MKDSHFSLTTRIERPAPEVFAWHERPGALARLCPPWERVEIMEASGGVRDGARVRVRTKIGPVWSEWWVEHRDYVEGAQFRDVQVSGPFAKWEHVHRFRPDEANANACWLTDEITYRLPGGAIGRVLSGEFVRRRLERLFRWRHATTKADVEGRRVTAKRILIAGASGLIGRALTPFLQTQGHTVLRLVRRKPVSAGDIEWNPAKRELSSEVVEGMDAIVNLSGANVGAGRWTRRRREEIVTSRVNATATLVRAMERLARKPEVFVSMSAAGFYGERGNERLTEEAASGAGFLAEVCRSWEAEALAAERLSVRTTRLRFGVVLTPAGGALAKLLPLFRAGVGGRVGDG
ncbi:MAG TPA: NAD-dependent epimerase/dehydratase family protein, partial [Opitutus sp.]|nr:NAD-dependent epimerase/dehydratase family protein [Opitutus sp.]